MKYKNDSIVNNKKIRVLHLPDTLSIRSGIMNVIMSYYRKINKKDIQFDFLCFRSDINEQTYEKELLETGSNIYYIEDNLIDKQLKFSYHLKSFSEKTCDKYDIIHYHAISRWALLLKYINKNCSFVKVISHSHSTKLSDNILAYARNFIYKLYAHKYTDYYFACSREALNFLLPKNYKTLENSSIIKNAIDTDKFLFDKQIRNKLREELEINDKFVVGNVGRFSKGKNHIFLINIFSEMLKIKENCVLVIVGSGEQRKKIDFRVKKLQIEDKVIILGQRGNVSEIMNVFDIFILPSKFEGLGIVAIEAQTNGISTFVSNRVPDEAKISDYFYTLSLNDTPKRWAEKILSIDNSNRFMKKPNQDDYNINLEANKLILKYKKIIGG